MQYVNLLICAVCSYVTLMRDLHICSIIVKIYATCVLHISIFVRVNTPLQPNVTAPQHACKHFYGIQHSSNRVLSPSWEATPPYALDPTTRGNVSIKTPLILHCNPMLQPPNMNASIFMESNTVPLFIVINRVSSPSWKATPPYALDVTAPQHACKHFYGIQHSSTFHCHQPSVIPEWGSHTPLCSGPLYKRERFYYH